MHERNSDPLALVASHQITQSPYQTHQHTYQNTQLQPPASTYPSPQYGSPYQSQQYSTHQSSTPLSVTYPSNDFQSSIHHNIYSPSSSIPQLEYPPQINQQSEFSQQDSGLIVPVFQKGDDPIDAINHMMSFFTAVVTSRYPTTNNQLRNSSNPRQQATINNGRVTLQPIQGRQTSFAAGTSRTYTPGASGSNSGKQRTVICYNCKGEGHMSRQCTKPKRKRDDSMIRGFNSRKYSEGQGIQTVITHNAAYQANDLIQMTLIVTNHTSAKVTSHGELISLKGQMLLAEKRPEHLLAERTLSKMLLKHNRINMMLEKEKQVDTTPIDYAALNQLNKDFLTRFVPQTELSAEQAFWSKNSVNSSEPTLSIRPTNVEDVVVKERPCRTALTKVLGIEHTKACFRDEIIPFVQALKDLFSTFNQHLVDELSEVQNVFYQMEQAVEQHRIESKTFEVKMNQVLNENERLLEQVMSKDIVNLLVNSLPWRMIL
ncbi:gag-pol polyprotein [Tanacetum coccineum]